MEIIEDFNVEYQLLFGDPTLFPYNKAMKKILALLRPCLIPKYIFPQQIYSKSRRVWMSLQNKGTGSLRKGMEWMSDVDE